MNLCMEEFERMNPIPAGVIRCGNGYAATDWGWASRDYVNAFKAFSDGWKASRAALCVELPSFENGSIRGYSGDCEEARMVIDCVAESLEAAGVSYK